MAPAAAASCWARASLGVLPGVVIFDLETAHDAPVGTYADRNLHECPPDQQHLWKERSQIIEFAAVDVRTGERFQVQCRPEFRWEDVISPAARAFAEDHDHDRIIKDVTLPTFAERWWSEVEPFLRQAAGASGRLAMIAHCGDRFDFAVLSREIRRLALSSAVGVEYVDPVSVLKQSFGPAFGGGGQLSLRRLSERFVPETLLTARAAAHHALSDCEALLEVVQHWPELRELLAWEVARRSLPSSEVPCASALLREMFECPGLGELGQAAVVLRSSAAEFVPGTPWEASDTGPVAGASMGIVQYQ